VSRAKDAEQDLEHAPLERHDVLVLETRAAAQACQLATEAARDHPLARLIGCL
jgi:hypothetical protein